MALDDEILRAASHDGTMDRSKWPEFFSQLVSRLDDIVYNEFPIPVLPVIGFEHPGPKMDSPGPDGISSPTVSQGLVPDSQPSAGSPTQNAIPPQLLSFYTNIKTNLANSFSGAPPFTIQRLAELVLTPSAHYRTLPSYLRALDRIVSVSSTADTFPLPFVSTAELEGNSNSLLASSGARGVADEFNGAALSRIPWLRDTASMLMSSDRPLTSDLRTESTSVIDGPNGAGSIETVTVSVNGVLSTTRNEITQTQEQQPMSTSRPPGRDTGSADDAEPSTINQDNGLEEEIIHVRGPEEMGMVDMGPQSERVGRAFDAEAAVGRPGEAEVIPLTNTVATDKGEDTEAGMTTVDSVDVKEDRPGTIA